MARTRMVDCPDCRQRRAAPSYDRGTPLCEACYDDAGMENAHSDGHHADAFHPDCPGCRAHAASAAAGRVVVAQMYAAASVVPPDPTGGFAIVIEYVKDPTAIGTALYRGGIADLTMVKTCLDAFAFLHPTWTILGVQVLAAVPGRLTQIMPVLD